MTYILTFIFACLWALPSYAASTCQEEFTDFATEEYSWYIEKNATVDILLLSQEEVLEAVEQNNTGLSSSDIDDIFAFLSEPKVEYYSVFVNTPIGGGSELYLVNTENCEILENYTIYSE